MKLSKTNYLVYRDCAHNAWVKAHLPDVYKAKPLSVFDQAIIETGNEVDVLARDLFPGGILVERGDDVGTAQLVAQRTAVLYQPVFETAQFTTACDILVWNAEANAYDLYEVKASTSGDDKKTKDELYAHDLAFQAQVLRENGVPLGALYLVRLNSEYVSDGALDLQELFTRENFSERVALIVEAVRADMGVAYDVLQREAGATVAVRMRLQRTKCALHDLRPHEPHGAGIQRPRPDAHRHLEKEARGSHRRRRPLH